MILSINILYALLLSFSMAIIVTLVLICELLPVLYYNKEIDKAVEEQKRNGKDRYQQLHYPQQLE